MGEYKFENTERAQMVVELMKEVEADEHAQEYPLSYYVEAAKDYKTLDDAKRYLIKPCPICDVDYPVHEVIILLYYILLLWFALSLPHFLQIVALPGCTDCVCKECFKMHFTITVKEKSVKHFNCPVCGEPDLANRDMSQVLYLELFVGLVSEPLAITIASCIIHRSMHHSISYMADLIHRDSLCQY